MLPGNLKLDTRIQYVARGKRGSHGDIGSVKDITRHTTHQISTTISPHHLAASNPHDLAYHGAAERDQLTSSANTSNSTATKGEQVLPTRTRARGCRTHAADDFFFFLEPVVILARCLARSIMTAMCPCRRCPALLLPLRRTTSRPRRPSRRRRTVRAQHLAGE